MIWVLVITTILAIAGCWTLVVLARSYVSKPGQVAAVDDAQLRPALVHYVIANCKPGTAAYEATILDLAARGFMSVSAHPTALWLAYTEAGAIAAGATKLAGYEQGVLDSMHGRLKNTGGAPFVALAEACRVASRSPRSRLVVTAWRDARICSPPPQRPWPPACPSRPPRQAGPARRLALPGDPQVAVPVDGGGETWMQGDRRPVFLYDRRAGQCVPGR